jgi:hypothetical protein
MVICDLSVILDKADRSEECSTSCCARPVEKKSRAVDLSEVLVFDILTYLPW